MAEDDDVIDLTSSPNFTLANHNRLNNIIIHLDDSSREEENLPSNSRRRAGRKRTHSQTRPAIDPRVPVQDLCTPDNKLQNKRRSKDSKKESKEIIITEEPKAKKAKTPGSCPICYDDFCGQSLASTKCGHVFCLKCLKQALKREPRCPTCRTMLKGKSGYHSLFL